MKAKRVLLGIFGGWMLILSLAAFYFCLHPRFLSKPAISFWMSVSLEYYIWLFAIAALAIGIRNLRVSYSGRDDIRYPARPIVEAFALYCCVYICAMPILMIWAHFMWPGDEARKVAAGMLIFYVAIAISAVSLIVFATKLIVRHLH